MRWISILFASICAAQSVPPPSAVNPASTPYVVRQDVPAPTSGSACWVNGRLTNLGCSASSISATFPITINAGSIMCPECAQFQRGAGTPLTCSANQIGRFYTNTTTTPAELWQCDGANYHKVGGGGAWGTITGLLSNQTDLWTQLQRKPNMDGSYPDPAWIATLDGSKIFNPPLGEGLVSDGTLWRVDAGVIPRYRVSVGAPTGACEQGRDLAMTTTGDGYDCPNGTWRSRPVSTGGGSSSATGVYSASLTFLNIPDGGVAESSYSAAGLAAGQPLAYGAPILPAGVTVTVYAKANEVWWRVLNMSGANLASLSGTFSVRDLGTLGYISGSGAPSFTAIPDGTTLTRTITVAGAAVGDRVALGPPSTLAPGLLVTAWVSAADTVSLRVLNMSGTVATPAGTFTASITR